MLKKLMVKNYKSLKDITVPLQSLTVLAGPNAAGKTNILDALSFVSDLARGEDPLGSRGRDFRPLVWGGYPANVCFTIEGTFQAEKDQEEPFLYSVEMRADGSQLVIEKEACLLARTQDVLLRRTGLKSWEVLRGGKQQANGTLPNWSQSAFVPIGTDHKDKELTAIRSVLTDCVFYDFIPHAMKQWQRLNRETRLSASGDNIAALLHSIQRAESPLYQDILDRLRAAVPRVEFIETDLTEGENPLTYVQLREKGIPRPIKSFNISEGTYRILGLILALFSPNPAGLVSIEGPETNVHPHLMLPVAENLIGASETIQVIATTHSPLLLDQLPAKSLIIVESRDGATVCRPVKGMKGLKEAQNILSLGEQYRSGMLGGVP